MNSVLSAFLKKYFVQIKATVSATANIQATSSGTERGIKSGSSMNQKNNGICTKPEIEIVHTCVEGGGGGGGAQSYPG